MSLSKEKLKKYIKRAKREGTANSGLLLVPDFRPKGVGNLRTSTLPQLDSLNMKTYMMISTSFQTAKSIVLPCCCEYQLETPPFWLFVEMVGTMSEQQPPLAGRSKISLVSPFKQGWPKGSRDAIFRSHTTSWTLVSGSLSPHEAGVLAASPLCPSQVMRNLPPHLDILDLCEHLSLSQFSALLQMVTALQGGQSADLVSQGCATILDFKSLTSRVSIFASTWVWYSSPHLARCSRHCKCASDVRKDCRPHQHEPATSA